MILFEVVFVILAEGVLLIIVEELDYIVTDVLLT